MHRGRDPCSYSFPQRHVMLQSYSSISIHRVDRFVTISKSFSSLYNLFSISGPIHYLLVSILVKCLHIICKAHSYIVFLVPLSSSYPYCSSNTSLSSSFHAADNAPQPYVDYVTRSSG